MRREGRQPWDPPIGRDMGDALTTCIIQILLQRNRRKNYESPETIGNLDTNWARDDNKKLFSFLTERCSKRDLSSPGIKPKPSAEEAQSLHHWTTRKIQLFNFKCNNGDVVTCTFFFF